jgi:hypothetical protein
MILHFTTRPTSSEGLEPPASRFVAERSVPLSYEDKMPLLRIELRPRPYQGRALP